MALSNHKAPWFNQLDGFGNMALWQKGILKIASVGAIRDSVGDAIGLKPLKQKYVPSETAEDAIAQAADLARQGFRTTLHHLCADLKSSKAIGESRAEIQAVLSGLNAEAIDVCVTFGLRQIGFGLSTDAAKRNVLLLADRFIQEATGQTANYAKRRKLIGNRDGFDPESLGPRRHFMTVAVEDIHHYQGSLELHRTLSRHGALTAVTVYACLERARVDTMALISSRSMIRLENGSCDDPKLEPVGSKAEVEENFMSLARLLLCDESKINNAFPIFATTNEEQIEELEDTISVEGWEKGSYEFELPYGVKTEMAEDLLARGHDVRLSLPFGKVWWPYVDQLIS